MDVIEVLPRLHMFRFRIGQAYLWRDGGELTLVDAGSAGEGAAVAEAIRDLGHRPEDIRRIVLTHWHPDHAGAAGEVAALSGAEVLAHRADAPVVRGEVPGPPPVLLDWERPLYEHALTVPLAPPTRVDRELEDGDVLGFGGGARVVGAPGHTDGSIALHLPEHGVLFTGDTVAHVEQLMLGVFNVDRKQALDSYARLAALGADTACFGHGDPLTGGAARALRIGRARGRSLRPYPPPALLPSAGARIGVSPPEPPPPG
ncbi:MBL fold metallo-hydrolase [Streptomyces sp. 7N604]|uniref:MBL fold metallo-hydrolase n=1 Tax=Streptomyces sp. 7N604 TaxID=3457415 RepID=UPI003FD5EF5C